MSSNAKKKSLSKNSTPTNEKPKHKKDKKNIYTEFKNGITERSSEDEEEK